LEEVRRGDEGGETKGERSEVGVVEREEVSPRTRQPKWWKQTRN
jgi:hypothetical protein